MSPFKKNATSLFFISSIAILCLFLFGSNTFIEKTISRSLQVDKSFANNDDERPNAFQTNNDQPKLLFRSGFEGTTTIAKASAQLDIIKGGDSESSELCNWSEDLKKTFPGFGFTYEGGDTTMRYARIVQDPGNKNNKVLKFWLAGANAAKNTKARVQASAYKAAGLKNMYQSVRFRFSDDLNTLKKWDNNINWLTLFEFWNNGPGAGKEDPFRVSVNIVKPDSKPNSPLYLRVTAQTYDRATRKFETVWSETNKNFLLSTEKWMKCDIFFKEGNREDGRFYIAVTPENGKKTVIADVTNFTHAPEAKNPDGLQEYQPFKLYTSKELMDFLSSKGKKLEVLWDDFELWTDKLPS